MTPLQIVALALRLLAVWLGLRALGYVVWFFWGRGSQPADYAYVIFMFALNAVIIPALWFFPRIIARKLLSSDDVQPQPSPTAGTWLAVGCALIGLWTIAETVPQLVYDIFPLGAAFDDPQRWVLVTHTVKLGIAIWLILGGKGFERIFRWAQDAGTSKDL